MITDRDLISYLEDLINEIKEDKVSNKKKFELTLLYIKDKYENEQSNSSDENNLKYISLGWYIYNFLLNK